MKHAKIDTNAIFSIRHDTLGSIHPNNSHYAVFNASQPGLTLLNKGFDGIAVKKGERYDFSFFAKTIKGKGGKLTVRLLDKNKKTIAETQMDVTSKLWKKTSAVLQATANADSATLALCPQAVSTYAFDMVSLFPQKTFKGRKNGLRADLAQTIADIHPRFMRFPGGCLTHVSSDLSVARIYLSLFPSERSKELYDAICANTKAIRFELGKRVHLQLRKIPELSFFIDDSLDYIDHIDSLLK